jgi:transcriptional regulator with XRE-family HTH domain
MNETILNKLLATAIKNGDVELQLNDTIVDSLLEQSYSDVPEIAKRRVKEQFRIRLQDAAIAGAKRSVEAKELPFGRFLEAVREKANLTRSDVGKRLQKTDEYVQRLERGDLNPVELPTRELADIVELFKLLLSAVREMITITLRTASTKETIRASARSHGGFRHDARGEDVERALDAFARKMARKSRPEDVELERVQTCISKLQEELKCRGQSKLLK